MKTWCKIFVLAFLLKISATSAQIGLNLDYKIENPILSAAAEKSVFDSNYFSFINNTPEELQDFDFINTFQPFPKIYSYHELAFFCKVEVKLEKAARFPIKFRLGDVNYVNRLEGK